MAKTLTFVAYTGADDPTGGTIVANGDFYPAYDYTSEYFGDYNELLYLRARYYAPGMGHFLTRDTWEGDYNNPLSLNQWMYVEGNPVNLTDPSGHYPVCDCGQGSTPDWWIKQLQVYIKGYGYIDPRHVDRGWNKGGWFIKQVEWALKMSDQYKLSGLGLPITIPLARAKSDERYWVDYAVSSNIDEKQKYGIAYGMYMDFERGYEELQSHRYDFLSGFSPADLPSDHLGFWAAMNGYEYEDLPIMLQCLGTLKVYPLQLPGGPVVDLTGFPKNHEFLPMVQETVLWEGLRIPTSTKNIAWPAGLEIQSIPSGPNTWQVLHRSYP